MKVTMAALTLFATVALGANTTSLCKSIQGTALQDNSICTSAGGKSLGKGNNLRIKIDYEAACDDRSATATPTGEACS
ncbi:hypothetical protein PpBr36_04358 [Pyricularia pennisetigena]|uniref:hypothetical protein n=1 Tax=Pyricularia pennisetigena TaxID=1578925 RepID=UPI001154647F|nr:hypothetical protein PpBr36_04358 [Pyricularia pennisetigena]TLS27561.1 hypothetical protein PpBr36_04358 [Pyricularia pennisetigena]